MGVEGARRNAMRRSIVAACALVLAALAGHGPVSAQTVTGDQHYEVCAGFAPGTPDQRIASCTWLLDNGGPDPQTAALVHMSRAIAYTRAGEVDSAHADFDRALDLKPDLIGAHGLEHALLVRHGRFGEALAVATRWIAADPSSIAYQSRGIDRILTGDLAGGARDYAEAIAQEGTADGKAQVALRVCGYLAKTLAALGRPDAGATAGPCADMLAFSREGPSEVLGEALDTAALAVFARTDRNGDDPEVLSLLTEARRHAPDMAPPEIRVREFDRMIHQRALQLLGLGPDDADGKPSPETRAAISELQRRNDLPVTGTLDAATAKTLESRIAERFSR